MKKNIYYEGYKRERLCHKCRDKESDYMFLGKPITEPNVVIWLCQSCLNNLPKDIFRPAYEIKMRTDEVNIR